MDLRPVGVRRTMIVKAPPAAMVDSPARVRYLEAELRKLTLAKRQPKMDTSVSGAGAFVKYPFIRDQFCRS